MTVNELKQYIFENEKIEHALESIGCHHIKYHANKEYYSCANYDGDNETAINIKNNSYLNVINWTRPSDFDEMADLITLTQYNKKISFVEAVKYLHSVLGLEFKYQGRVKKKPKIPRFIQHYKKHMDVNRINVEEIDVLDEEVLDDYVPYIHIDWFREGVMEWTRKKFGIMYSYRHSRVVIPHRYWLTGDLIGFNMRTTVELWKEIGIKKYFLSPGYNKAINLYGLWENREEIEKAGYVVVVEAEKSVLKRDSVLDHTLVALSGKSMSEEQRRILLGLNVKEIVIALDKDVPLYEVWHMCEKLWQGGPKVSYIHDKFDLLGSKDSPADARMKIYDYLFKYRVLYDESKHREYLKWLKSGGED